MPSYINWFDGEYAFLSNFYPCRVYMGDSINYPSVEHAFQAMKSTDLSERAEVSLAKHPADAKKAGKRLKLRSSWEDMKVDVMRQAVRSKFLDNAGMRKKLQSTGDAVLIEGNHHGDRFWGVDGYGENMLGRLLMELRQDINETFGRHQ